MLYGTSFFDCDYPFLLVPSIDFETGHHGVTKFDSAWEISTTDTDRSWQVFDENNNIVYAACHKFITGNWQNYISRYYYYDGNNNLLKEVDSNWQSNGFVNVNQYISTYDSNNRVISEISQISDTALWSQSLYTYAMNNNLTIIEGANWNNKSKNWQNNGERVIRYGNNNKPDSFLIYYTDPSGMDIGSYYFSKDNDTMITNTGLLLATNTYDYLHNKISSTQEVIEPGVDWLSNSKVDWTYNANNQVTCERNYTLDSTGNWVFVGLNRYYYETYETENPFSINNLVIFPSPAKNNITIKLEWAQSQPFSVALFDAAGRLAMQWSEPAAQKYLQMVNVSYLAAGNYFISVTSGKQKLVKQFVLIN